MLIRALRRECRVVIWMLGPHADTRTHAQHKADNTSQQTAQLGEGLVWEGTFETTAGIVQLGECLQIDR
jgi:hypothetical protein